MEIEVFDSFLDVPLDKPGQDGDDRLVPGGEGVQFQPEPNRMLMMAAVSNAALKETLVVPFKGPLKPHSTGRPVVALKRSLAHAGYMHYQGVATTPYFGVRTAKALRHFKRDQHLSDTPVYGLKTHARLARFYDRYSIRWLLRETMSLDDKNRIAFLAELMYLYNHRWNIRYSQARPFDTRKPPWASDCSGSGEWAAKWSGLPSLSGYDTYGYGNTDTQYARFRYKGWLRNSIVEAETGDPKYYGSGGDPSHVAFYIGKSGGVYRVFSFGSYPCKILPHDYRGDGIKVCNLTGR